MMATGKARGIKRNSGALHSSTFTTIIFVSLCILGVWLLVSNPLAPLHSLSQTGKKTPAKIQSIAHSRNPRLPLREAQPVHEDIPGELLDDPVVLLDHGKPNGGTQKVHESGDHSESASSYEKDQENLGKLQGKESLEEQEKQRVLETQTSEESSMTQNQEVERAVEQNQIEIREPVKIGDRGSDEKDQENLGKLQGKEFLEEQEKQRVLETQTSEESSMTHNQEVEQVVEQNQTEIMEQVKIGDRGSDEKGGDSEEIEAEKSSRANSSHVTGTRTVTDEEQERRIDEHQKDEDDQIEQGQKEEKMKRDPEGAISNDQIQHDEAPTNDSDTKQPKHQEVKHSDEVSIPKESKESKKSWSTQEDESEDQKGRRGSVSNDHDNDSSVDDRKWRLCNETAGADYIPCLDNEKVIAKIHNRKHHEHRERHCPDEPPTCLVPLPKGYKRPIEWPQSRDKIWYHNVPHTSLADMKGHQNWVKVTGEFLTFPGGGTQFIHGALHYIDFLQEAVPDISWGKHTRVVLDVGCGVASFGGYLFDRDVLTMSFAPKDEHEAQVQFALERGIPAISAVMGSQRLPFPGRVFDLVHCARCRVPWHEDGGALLLELNRVLRPGGYFVWSATPVYQKLEEDVKIWREMSNLTVAMCWELVTIKNDKVNSIGAAIYQKPDSNDCYEQRNQNRPPMCENDDDPNAAWYVPLRSCMHRVPLTESERGSQWPEEWADRLHTSPYWLNKSQVGIYGKPAPDDFKSDYKHWKNVVKKSYVKGLGINWSNVRNVMDMRAVYGGFAAAMKDLKVWVMNVVNVDSPDTLPIIYERGLFGMYHDWCESFSTYPRTYDLLHADHLFSNLRKRCKLVGVMTEIDRLVRPGGTLVVRDESSVTGEIRSLLQSLHWDVQLNVSSGQERVLSATKSSWRPDTYAVRS